MRLYGRDDVLHRIIQRVKNAETDCQIIKASSGMGKTELLNKICSDIHQEKCFAVKYELRNRSDSLDYVIGCLSHAVKQDLKKQVFDFNALKDYVLSNYENLAKDMTLALGMDLLKDLLPVFSESIANLSKQLSELCEAYSINLSLSKLEMHAKQDSIAIFLSIIHVLCKSQGISGVIVLDKFEVSNEQVRNFVISLVETLPENWSVLIAINDEKLAGINVYNEIWPELNYYGAIIEKLKPLEVQHLDMWKRNQDEISTDVHVLKQVITNCEGRPLFLKDWVEGISTEAETSPVFKKVLEYYRTRISSLDSLAKESLFLLSLFPFSSRFELSMLTEILKDESSLNVQEVLRNLCLKNFLEEIHEDEILYCFAHEVTNECICEILQNDVKKYLAQKILSVDIGVLNRFKCFDDFTAYHLHNIIDDDEYCRNHVVTISNLAMRNGDYYQSIESVSQYIEKYKPVDELLIALQICKSKLLLLIGHYHESIGVLQDIKCVAKSEHHNETFFVLAECYVRLNQYWKAAQHIEEFYAQNAENNSELKIKMMALENVIYRDLGQYDKAVEQSRSFLATARQQNCSDDTISKCMRNYARSLALSGQADQAIAVAQEAFQYAKTIRDIGNCHFTLGECYRHNMSQVNAISEYCSALAIAKKISNRDCLIWSALGLTDSYFIDGQKDLARFTLDNEVGVIVQHASNRYPLEFLHWKFTSLTMDFYNEIDCKNRDEIEETIEKYVTMGILWPKHYYIVLEDYPETLHPKHF